GGGPPVAPGSSAAVDTELRIDRLETEMRDLTGRLENTANGIEQLRRRLEQIKNEIDVRFGQGQPATRSQRPTRGGAGARAAAGTPAPRGVAPTTGPPPPAQPNSPLAPGTLVPPPYTPTGLGTLTPPGSPARPAQPAPEPVGAGGVALRPPASGNLPAGSPS